MPLQPPKLDDRTFESLFKEARARIPRYLPDWTDWNESDPGITLLQLQAWLAETILFRLNQLPELNYVKFLQLLGVEQRPAQPAKAELTFLLKENLEKENVAEVLIEKGTVVGVSDRDLPQPLFFETDRTLRAITARLALVVRLAGGVAIDETQASQLEGRTFAPFGDPVRVNASLMLGFTSRLPFSRHEVGLHWYLAEEGQALLAPPAAATCGPSGEDAPRLLWQWWDGSEWDELQVTEDQTEGLTRSGQVFFRVPGQIPAVPAQATVPAQPGNAGPVHATPVLADVASLTQAQIEALMDAGTNTVAALAGSTPETVAGILDLDLEDEDDAAMVEAILADAIRLRDRVEPLYFWLRVAYQGGVYANAPRVDQIVTNTVEATAAQTVFDEAVASSDGTPNQVMFLRHSPVLAASESTNQEETSQDPAAHRAHPPSTLVLEVDEGSGPEPWVEVQDFYGSKPAEPHYMLNRSTGQITFGDGRRGRIPVAGQLNVIARQYRYGGGAIGNVGTGTINTLITPIREVDSVTNTRQAKGGQDEESLDETKLRGPRDVLKTRDRAVTLEDFALLAQQTPGALVARGHAYVTSLGNEDGAPVGRQINVVVVPQSKESKPVPSETARHLVCRYLDERRLITTRVRVQGPLYHDIDVALDVFVRDDADLKAVHDAIRSRLQTYFHPLQGGPDNAGWPFGRDVFYSELLREIMLIEGVLRVESGQLRKLLGGTTGAGGETALLQAPFCFATEDEARAAEATLLQAEADAFPDARISGSEIVRVVQSNEGSGDPPSECFYVAAVYDCEDLPVADGGLLALRETDISVRYNRARRPR